MAPLRVLEFYSGIGGLRYSLQESKVDAIVVEAFEINDVANDVYQHNFGHRPNQGNIQRLTARCLDKHRADVWLLSPPCQPYTRQGLRKDSADARAASFLMLVNLLPNLFHAPKYIFVENVVGFESSATHSQLIGVLQNSGFKVQEFILSPVQFGIPYSRPRYFCLAKSGLLRFGCSEFDGCIVSKPVTLQDISNMPLSKCTSVQNYLEMNDDNCTEYQVPKTVVDRWGDALDIVTPASKRCCCFTKSYGRFAKGTGSVLVTNLNTNPTMLTKDDAACLANLSLRYFTPREVANLHSFPKDFKFPEHIHTKQRYALLGNSLNIKVVSHLLQYLFYEGT